jgi:hypothetical protein
MDSRLYTANVRVNLNLSRDVWTLKYLSTRRRARMDWVNDLWIWVHIITSLTVTASLIFVSGAFAPTPTPVCPNFEISARFYAYILLVTKRLQSMPSGNYHCDTSSDYNNSTVLERSGDRVCRRHSYGQLDDSSCHSDYFV